MNTFEQLDLFAPIQRALAEQNYRNPTPIQAQTIPAAIEGCDILGCAQTGTGKTAAFALPILDFLGHEKPRAIPNQPNVLVLAPTRELAIQIGESFSVYGKYMPFRQALVYGGVSQHAQVKALRGGAHVLVATPGRLLDLMDQRHVHLRGIELFVLDEADRMLDMGFMPALTRIIRELPDERHSLFFSATMPPKIRELSERLLFNPTKVNVTPKTSSVERIEQSVRYVERATKLKSLIDLLGRDQVQSGIVFTRTKHGANALARKLEGQGYTAAAIHGNKSQGARQRALEAFRNNEVRILVATDVAARGIDIDGVTHVINYDMPVDPESYVHRTGRTGRAGAAGIAVSFCTAEELDELEAIEKLIGQSLKIENPEMQLKRASRSESPGQARGSRSPGDNRPNTSGRRFSQKGRRPPRQNKKKVHRSSSGFGRHSATAV